MAERYLPLLGTPLMPEAGAAAWSSRVRFRFIGFRTARVRGKAQLLPPELGILLVDDINSDYLMQGLWIRSEIAPVGYLSTHENTGDR
jgi:hypothetical protein